MAYYRLYTLGAAGGHFIGAEEISAADDIEAVRLAQSMAAGRPRELWCGKRKVKSLPATEAETV